VRAGICNAHLKTWTPTYILSAVDLSDLYK
jgi:hypothetical protein